MGGIDRRLHGGEAAGPADAGAGRGGGGQDPRQTGQEGARGDAGGGRATVRDGRFGSHGQDPGTAYGKPLRGNHVYRAQASAQGTGPAGWEDAPVSAPVFGHAALLERLHPAEALESSASAEGRSVLVRHLATAAGERTKGDVGPVVRAPILRRLGHISVHDVGRSSRGVLPGIRR